jgi:hypothetical protein
VFAYHPLRAVYPVRPSRREAREATARELLARFDLDGVARWAEGEPQAARVLQHLTFDTDELVAWRAVEAIGRVAGILGRGEAEPARELVRRTFWLMNDESGGLLWKGPPIAGAVLAHVPPLCREFGSILASFLEEEPFRGGARWALWRVSGVAPDVVRDVAGALGASFADRDPGLRGLTALALLGAGLPVPALDADLATFTLFDFRTGALRETTVAAASRPNPRSNPE